MKREAKSGYSQRQSRFLAEEAASGAQGRSQKPGRFLRVGGREMKKAILVVSFGTSYEETQKKDDRLH